MYIHIHTTKRCAGTASISNTFLFLPFSFLVRVCTLPVSCLWLKPRDSQNIKGTAKVQAIGDGLHGGVVEQCLRSWTNNQVTRVKLPNPKLGVCDASDKMLLNLMERWHSMETHFHTTVTNVKHARALSPMWVLTLEILSCWYSSTSSCEQATYKSHRSCPASSVHGNSHHLLCRHLLGHSKHHSSGAKSCGIR